ncbi:hypothetical protein BAE44_0025097 [Dichanthelium oligosanthes]|uniref:F-box domain-containing protein n=1 Tax=Dichanthelium oligosanthes TaxID=888268 RepID=A0A1E5ULY0_9POAL|nr:hypothetical protein BAE44_0025097 [Dichanthelium oligosanthes]
MDADMWSSLPCDLLVEILRRLYATAVVRCAGACRPWRRAIIANASCLRPRPDRFNPNLFIGFFYRCWPYGPHVARLEYVPGPFENDLTMRAAGTPCYMRRDDPCYTTLSFFIPRAATGGVGVEQ